MNAKSPRYRGILDRVVSGALGDNAQPSDKPLPGPEAASQSDSAAATNPPVSQPTRRESLAATHGRVSVSTPDTFQSIRTAEIHVPALFNRLPKSFDAANPAFAELVQSLQSTDGNVQPIVVRPLGYSVQGKRFELVAGERRLRACESLGIRVNAVVRQLTDEQFVLTRLSENTNRTDLSVWEKALVIMELLEENNARRWARGSAQRIGDVLGMHVDSVTRYRRVATQLPASLSEAHPDIQTVSFRELEALAQLRHGDQATFDSRLEEMKNIKWSSPAEATRYLLGQESNGKKSRARGQVSYTWRGETLQVELPKDNAELQAQFRKAFEKLVAKFR